MSHPANKLNKKFSPITALLLTTVLAGATSVSNADEASVVYVDSVLKWGAWELDIEPAAGGISPAKTRALNTRNSKVVLRTNSIAALAPPASPKPPVIPTTPSTPIAPPVVPVTPPPPVIPAIPAGPTDFAPPGATPPTTVTLPGASNLARVNR